MINDTRFVAGANMDGALWGSVATLGVASPFLLMAKQDDFRANVTGWMSFWNASTGYKRDILFNGTLHTSFTDMPALVDGTPLGSLVSPSFRAQFGSINGLRMLNIETAYIRAFLAFG